MEIDDYCQRVLAKHWPHVTRYGDIRTVVDVELVDVLCGGFPCQDISNAGKRAGIDGERSGLWSEYVRLIRLVRPRYVLVENVAALLGRGMGRVLGDLSESGYDAEWDVIRACDMGAPHRRERIWIVAYPKGNGDQELEIPYRRTYPAWPLRTLIPYFDCGDGGAENVANPESNLRPTPRDDRHEALNRSSAILADTESAGKEWVRCGPERNEATTPVTCGEVRNTHGSRLEGQRIFTGGTRAELGDAGNAGWWTTEPDVGRVAHGIPARVDRLKGLGNAIVPQIAEWIGHRILEHERGVSK